MKYKSSYGGLEVEYSTMFKHRRCSTSVDRIPLGETIPAIIMFYILSGNYTTYIFGLTVKFGLTVRPNGK